MKSFLKDFEGQHYQLEHYEEVIAPLVYPRWYNIYKRLTKEQTIQPFCLQGKEWASRLSALVLSASRRVLWALDMPPLNTEHRHRILNSLRYCQNKGIRQHCYFNKTYYGTPRLKFEKIENNKAEADLDVFKSESFHFSFMLVDDVVVFERPSLAYHKQHTLYLLPKVDTKRLEWLLAMPYINLTKEEQKEFLLQEAS